MYAVVTPLLSLYHERSLNRQFWLRQIPVVVGGIALLLQAVLIYVLNFGAFYKEPSGLELRLNGIFVWFLTPGIAPDVFVFTFLVPIAAVALFWRRLAWRHLVYPALLWITGLLIATTVHETGPRAHHGNFNWQNVLTTYALWLMSVVAVITAKPLPLSPDGRPVRDWRLSAFWGVILLHALAGMYYIGRILVENQYE